MAIGLTFQPVTDPRKLSRNRYPEKVIADRVEAARKERDVTVADAAESIGLSEWSWYKKADGTTPFKVHELGRIAERLKAPPGWPFMDWSVAELFQRYLERLPMAQAAAEPTAEARPPKGGAK